MFIIGRKLHELRKDDRELDKKPIEKKSAIVNFGKWLHLYVVLGLCGALSIAVIVFNNYGL